MLSVISNKNSDLIKLIIKMDETNSNKKKTSANKRSSSKYKEDNPQAPDKVEIKRTKHKKSHKLKKRESKRKHKKEREKVENNPECSDSEQKWDSSVESDPEIKREEQIEKDRLTLLLLSEVIEQVKEFSAEKVIDFVEISKSSPNLNDWSISKDLYYGFRKRLIQSTPSCEVEYDWKKNIMESFANEVQETFPHRLQIYESKCGNMLKKEEEYTHQMIDSWLSLTGEKGAVDKMEEFSKLCRINEEFLSYLKREERGYSNLSFLPNSPARPDSNPSISPSHQTSLDYPLSQLSESQLYDSLYLELKNYEINRLRNLGALVKERDLKEPKFSEIETANLLRGVYKYGEGNWKSILSEESFHKSRTVNQLILKWRMIKIFMKGELDSLNLKRQKLVTRSDWIVAAIKSLEKKNGIKRELTVNHVFPLGSHYYKNWGSLSDEGGEGSSICKNRDEEVKQWSKFNKEHDHSKCFNENPWFAFDSWMHAKHNSKNNFSSKGPRFPPGMSFLSFLNFSCWLNFIESENRDDDVSEEESEEECPDYFANITHEKNKSHNQVPPQNYIKPKNRKLFKLMGSRSFKQKAKKKEDKIGFNIELI